MKPHKKRIDAIRPTTDSENLLNPPKPFPIEPMTPVIVRDKETRWTPGMFMGYERDLPFGLCFAVYGPDCAPEFYQMVAPLSCNTTRVNSQDDVHGLWDMERMIEEEYLGE